MLYLSKTGLIALVMHSLVGLEASATPSFCPSSQWLLFVPHIYLNKIAYVSLTFLPINIPEYRKLLNSLASSTTCSSQRIFGLTVDEPSPHRQRIFLTFPGFWSNTERLSFFARTINLCSWVRNYLRNRIRTASGMNLAILQR